jgi:hypothetical protein
MCSDNAQLKWQHEQLQLHVQRLTLQSQAPPLVQTPVVELPPVSLAQAQDFFASLAGLSDSFSNDGSPAVPLPASAPNSRVIPCADAAADAVHRSSVSADASPSPLQPPASPPPAPPSPALSSPAVSSITSQSPFKAPTLHVSSASMTASPASSAAAASLYSPGQRAVIVGVSAELNGGWWVVVGGWCLGVGGDGGVERFDGPHLTTASCKCSMMKNAIKCYFHIVHT